MKPVPTLDALDVAERTVLVRVDFNVPMDGERVADDTRIVAALPTLRTLRERGARLVLCSHLGRPKGKPDPSLSLLPAAARLAELLEVEVVFAHDVVGDEVTRLARGVPRDGVVVLENLRFDPGEKAGDATFAKALASMGDVFVNDAFGAMHRAHASITGVPALLPSAAGLLVQAEVEALGSLRGAPRPFAAILGGAKVSDKIGVIEQLSRQVDHMFIGGAMAYAFLAADGQPIGSSKVDPESVDAAAHLQEHLANHNVALHLPVDHVVVERFAEDAPHRTETAIPDGWMGVDVGPATVTTWGDVLAGCRTVLWNGPVGVFEWSPFSHGTRGLALLLANGTARTIIGGGDSAAAVKRFGLADRYHHVSTGGGASLEYIQHGDLVGLEALRRSRS